MSIPAKKWHYSVLTACLVVCILIYADVYLFPLRSNIEVVTDSRSELHYSKTTLIFRYFIKTQRREYKVPASVYNGVDDGDSIVVFRSLAANSAQKIAINREGYKGIYDIGYLLTNSRCFIFALLPLGIITTLIFYNYIKYLPGRTNLTVFLAITTLYFLIAHLNLFNW